MKNVKALIPPPLPLLPKSYAMSLDEPAKTGLSYKFIQLQKFRGRDQTCKIEELTATIEKHEFNPSSLLTEIFDINKNEKNIVYLWTSQKEQKSETVQINSLNKDWYIFENTMDIKKILRNAAYTGGEEKN